ncbi:phospholipase D family protein [Ruania suaedae]|uniref:phospholipase D family protein n=1 Tax=Ruania suaedae TaxID=2897774 RepID=UPI0025B62DD7|nr:phospholipase D family protein [Ruania suaedae]
MSLQPQSRTLLTDALRPPDGFDLDCAVATTYTLSLTAALMLPLAFTDRSADGPPDPVAILDAVQRYGDRVTVFCQSGAIGVPRYRSLLALLEESVHAVTAPTPGRIFHPKVWALRFTSPAGEQRHRVVVLSRNLTLDTSWDTALVLDEQETPAPVDTAPITAFLDALPDLAIRPLPHARRRLLADLSRTLAGAHLAPPAPYTGAAVLPLGLPGQRASWPIPERARRVLAISPFLDRTQLARLPRATDRTLLARPEALDRVGGRALENWHTFTLATTAEPDPETDLSPEAPEFHPPEPDSPTQETDPVRSGLHAKVLIADLDARTSRTIVGSANLTSAAWGNAHPGGAAGNVEVAVVLDGPAPTTGVRAVFEGEQGLSRVLATYRPELSEPVEDPLEPASMALEEFHRHLASRPWQARMTDSADTFEVTITAPDDLAEPPATRTRVWLASLPAGRATRLTPGVELRWTQLPATHVTPFLAIESTTSVAELTCTRRCVVQVHLDGDDALRRRAAVRDVLAETEDVTRYLLFLLDGTPGAAGPAESLLTVAATGSTSDDAGPAASAVLYEPLVRAAVAQDGRFERIQHVVEDLLAADDGANLLPPGFLPLWQAVQEARA